MSNELKLSLALAYANGAVADSIPLTQTQVTQATLGYQSDVIDVSSSAQADIATANITTYGWLYLKNLDATNYVQWGPKSGGSMVAAGRLKPGEFALLRLEPGITLRWVAHTAAVKVLTKFFED